MSILRLWMGVVISVLSMSAFAQVAESVSCPGAFEEISGGGSVISRVIPGGGSATCVTSPEAALGLEPYIRGSGDGTTLTIAAGVEVPLFILDGNSIELLNAGISAGNILGNDAQVRTSIDSELELVVVGTGTIVENLGSSLMDITGDGVNVANGGQLGLSVFGSGRFRNDPDALAQVFFAGDGVMVDNLGVLTSLEVQGDGTRILNTGSTSSLDFDGVADGLGILVVGADTDIINRGFIGESGTGPFDGGLGIAVQGDRATVDHQAGFITTVGPDAVSIGVEGDDADIDNAAGIAATGLEATGIFVEGNRADIRMATGSLIHANGAGTTAISVEGDAAVIDNLGEIGALGALASGIFVAGSDANISNGAGGVITIGGGAVAGAAAFGNGAVVVNAGTVNSTGTNGFGLAAIGLGEDLTNAGVITTSGANADAIVLGLENLPPGLESLTLPPGAFNPSQGGVTNAGTIETGGAGADGISGFADGSSVANTGTIDTAGDDARGIALRGTGNLVVNGSEGDGALSGIIRTEGGSAHGIDLSGADPLIEVAAVNHGLIQTRGDQAHGISANANANDAVIENEQVILVGGSDAFGISSNGRGSVTNSGSIRAGDPLSPDVSGAGGIRFAADQTVSNAGSGEITVFGDDGRGISSLNSNGATVANAGMITIAGSDGIGVEVVGPGAAQPVSSVVNSGLVRVGGNELLDPAEAPDPELNPLLVPAESGVGVRIGGHANATNEATGRIVTLGDNSAGIMADDTALLTDTRVLNHGMISTQGVGARGIDLVGDDVIVYNGAVGDTANIQVQGANSYGIRTRGTNQFVSNAGVLGVSGDNSTSMAVELTGEGALWVDSSELLSTSGTAAIAMHVSSLVDGQTLNIEASSPGLANCIGGGLVGGRIINCGGIQLNDGQSATGMLVQGIADTFIENQGGIVGTGDGQRGIVIEAANGLAVPEGQVNFIENLAAVDLTGQGVSGVVINGSGNFLLNGTGVTRFDLVPGLPEGLTGTIASNIDKMTSRGTGIGSIESQQVGAQGIIEVDGVGARGLVVNGTANLISNRISQVLTDDVVELEGRIVASGVGSIGIELSGNGHVVDNDGLIQGELFAIFADDGSQSLVNKNTINGNVALGGGDDNLVFVPGATFTGQVDGGDGTDELQVVYRADADIDSDFLIGGAIDGDRFTNFEHFLVDLEAPVPAVVLENTLVVDEVDITSGVLLLDDAFLNSPDIYLGAFTGIAGSGLLGSIPTADPGAFGVTGSIFLADESSVSAGNSPGELTFLGDVTSAGLFEIEIGGVDVALHDVINVEGDLDFLGGGFNFTFIDGFLPSAGDTFEFLNVSGLIAGFDLLTTSFAGLPAGFGFDFSLSDGGLLLAASMVPGGPGPGASVPEPGAGLLMLGGVFALFFTRRRRRTDDR